MAREGSSASGELGAALPEHRSELANAPSKVTWHAHQVTDYLGRQPVRDIARGLDLDLRTLRVIQGEVLGFAEFSG